MIRRFLPLFLLAATTVLGPQPLAEAAETPDPGCLSHPVAFRSLDEADDALAPCRGIRPGGALILRSGPLEIVYCSMSFIVTDGTDVYISTAGHCVDEEFGVPSLGERASAHGVPGTFGTVAYQWCEGRVSNGPCTQGADFGLIRVDADKLDYVSREMCTWGAPDGLHTTGVELGREIRHFGWGMGVAAADVGANVDGRTIQPANPATQARRGVGAFGEAGTSHALIRAPAFSGDSGSGVLISEPIGQVTLKEPPAQALGVLTHVRSDGIVVVQRLDASLARAGADLGGTFTLW
jgi:hypothetical protein